MLKQEIVSTLHSSEQVYTTYRYTFDRVYGPASEQAELYEHSARDAVHQALEVRPRPLTCDPSATGRTTRPPATSIRSITPVCMTFGPDCMTACDAASVRHQPGPALHA